MHEGYGGVFQFNAPADLLHRAADEAMAVFSVLVMLGSPFAGDFMFFNQLFEDRAKDPNPPYTELMHSLVGRDATDVAKVLELLMGLAGRPEAPASQAWQQLRSAIVARERARNPESDDRA